MAHDTDDDADNDAFTNEEGGVGYGVDWRGTSRYMAGIRAAPTTTSPDCRFEWIYLLTKTVTNTCCVLTFLSVVVRR